MTHYIDTVVTGRLVSTRTYKKGTWLIICEDYPEDTKQGSGLSKLYFVSFLYKWQDSIKC